MQCCILVAQCKLSSEFPFACGHLVSLCVDTRHSTQAYSEKLVRLPTFFNCLQKTEMKKVAPGEAPPMVRDVIIVQHGKSVDCHKIACKEAVDVAENMFSGTAAQIQDRNISSLSVIVRSSQKHEAG